MTALLLTHCVYEVEVMGMEERRKICEMVEAAAVDDRVRGSDDARSCNGISRVKLLALLPLRSSAKFPSVASHACHAKAVTLDLRALPFAHSCL